MVNCQRLPKRKKMMRRMSPDNLLVRLLVCVSLFGLISSTAGAEALLTEKPEGQAWLSMPVSGVVEQVLVNTGDSVKKGDKLVVLERDIPEAEFKAAETLMESAKADKNEQKRERDRSQELFDRTLLSVVDLQKAELTYQRAEADYQQKRLSWLHARYRFDKSVLKAPFDGVVKARRVEPGEYVASEFSPRVLIILERR